MKDGKINYINDRVMVANSEKGIITIQNYEYQDNIKEIFKIENIIEELENEKEKLNNRINLNNDSMYNLKKMNKMLTIMWICLPIFATILGCFVGINTNTIIKFGLKGWQTMGIIGTVLSSALIGPIILFQKSWTKTLKKCNNGYKFQIEALKKELVKNKKNLNQLKSDKTKDKQEEAKERSSDNIHNIHLEEYKKIRSQLMLYYEIGENENEFSKYYNEGILEEKLNEIYEPEEIEKIKTYFKSKK